MRTIIVALCATSYALGNITSSHFKAATAASDPSTWVEADFQKFVTRAMGSKMQCAAACHMRGEDKCNAFWLSPTSNDCHMVKLVDSDLQEDFDATKRIVLISTFVQEDTNTALVFEETDAFVSFAARATNTRIFQPNAASNQVCDPGLPNYPRTALKDQVFTYAFETFVVCGGNHSIGSDTNYEDKCVYLDMKADPTTWQNATGSWQSDYPVDAAWAVLGTKLYILSGELTSKFYSFDFETKAVEPVLDLLNQHMEDDQGTRKYSCFLKVDQNTMAVLGGTTGNEGYTKEARLFDAEARTWTDLPIQPEDTRNCGLVIYDGRHHIIAAHAWEATDITDLAIILMDVEKPRAEWAWVPLTVTAGTTHTCPPNIGNKAIEVLLPGDRIWFTCGPVYTSDGAWEYEWPAEDNFLQGARGLVRIPQSEIPAVCL